MEYVLQTNALEKSCGHYRALKGLTMSVPKGQIYGLVGKNGAGKTTLIRLIVGHARPKIYLANFMSVTAFLGSYIMAGIIRRLVFCFYNNESVSDVFSFLSEERVSRPLLEFLYDFLPMGQCLQLTTDTVFHPFRLPLYSFLFTGLTLLCGIGIFGGKDVK